MVCLMFEQHWLTEREKDTNGEGEGKADRQGVSTSG